MGRVAVGLASLYIARSLHIASDLRLFLTEPETPRSASPRELKDGPATRVLLVALSGLPPDQLAAASDRVDESLRTDALFAVSQNGTLQSDLSCRNSCSDIGICSAREGGSRAMPESLRRELESRCLNLARRRWRSPRLRSAIRPANWTAILDSCRPRRTQAEQRRLVLADGQEALAVLQTVAAGFDRDRQRAPSKPYSARYRRPIRPARCNSP